MHRYWHMIYPRKPFIKKNQSQKYLYVFPWENLAKPTKWALHCSPIGTLQWSMSTLSISFITCNPMGKIPRDTKSMGSKTTTGDLK